MAKKIVMADIAKHFGVSTVTVSKALSGQKGVSEQLRVQIMEFANKMGYHTSGKMEMSEEKRSFNIGILVSDTYITKYSTFYWELYQALTTMAAKENCFLMLELLNEEQERNCEPMKLLKEQQVSGVIVLGKIHKDYLLYLKRTRIPLLFMDFYDRDVREDCVISNGFYGMYYLTNYLFDKGHTDLAFVGNIYATDSIMDRFLGFSKSMLEHGKNIGAETIISDRDESRMCFEQILMPEHMPTAFVCNCDETAVKVIKGIKDMGLRVPEDVSVVGYDDYLHPGLCDVPLTTYSVNMKQMARDGIDIILKKIKKERQPGGIHVVEGALIERKSVAQK